MPESGTYGSVRGALSNERPYRDPATTRLSTCGCGRRPKSAKARSRGELGNWLAASAMGICVGRACHRDWLATVRVVAVGTLIAERPPHRSRRALLTHRALPSDGGVEAVARHWVSYADRWEEAFGDANKAVPVETRSLASSP